MSKNLYTYGYEGRSIEAFITRLKLAGVRTVIDVRGTPLSRKRGFSKTAFGEALHAAGILYTHIPAMGCPKPVRDRYKADADWTAYTSGFLGYLSGQGELVDELAALARDSTSCLVCFEADFNYCHRTYVARAAAKVRDLRIVHLTTRGSVVDSVTRAAAA